MSAASQGGLWTLALAGSLALHGAAGMALLAMPAPRAPETLSTEITIASLPTAAARAPTPIEAAPTAAAEQVAAVSEASSDALQPVEEQAAPAPVDQLASAPVVDRLEAAAATTSEALAPADETQAATTSEATAPLAPVAPTTTDATVAAVAEPVAPLAEAEAAAPVESDRDAALSDDAPAALAATETESTLPVIAVPADEAPTTSETADLPAISENVAAPTVAPPVAVAPSSDTAAAVEAMAPDAVAVTSPSVEAQPQVSAPAAPSTSIPQASSSTALAPVVEAPAGSSPALAPVVVTESPQVVEAIEEPPAAPSAEAPPADQQLAMVVPDEPQAPQPAELPPLAAFLKGYEVPDCILALPTGAAAVEVLSDSPAPLAALNAQYEALTARPIAAERQPVTRAQCGSLSFARDIASYPNYPLSIALGSAAIDSGAALSGTVSGLRKNTLYLMVVDDEGQAKLVESLSGITDTSVAFTSPMTLTAGPVASAQLLVAIAADGPLRTVASKTGMPADDYFKALRAEIIADQRSIHFGIAAFSIR